MGIRKLVNCPHLIIRTVLFIHEVISDNSSGGNVASSIYVMMTHFAQEFASWNEHIVEENGLASVTVRFRCAHIALRVRPFFPHDTRA
jgi:hypothetical protein